MPESKGSFVVKRTIVIPAGEHRDFGFQKLVPHKRLGDGSQKEGQRPVLVLLRGASVSRVIIGKPGADGIHCAGKNSLRDVWFDDVGEDAVTVQGPDVLWSGGGARKASDKIVQMNHKGPFTGENLRFENFQTAVRGCGGDDHAETRFRVILRHIGARDGRTLIRLTSEGAVGTAEDCLIEKVGQPFDAQNGSRISTDRIRNR